MMGFVKEPVPEPVLTTKLLVNVNENTKQDQGKIPNKFALLQPSELWSKLKSWRFQTRVGTTPFSLVYYVKTDKLDLLNFILFTPWICGVLLACTLPITAIAEAFLLSGDRNNSSANRSATNMSSQSRNDSFPELTPVPLEQLVGVFAINLDVLLALSMVYLHVRPAIRRKTPDLHALKHLTNRWGPKCCHWPVRVVVFLAIFVLTCMTSYWQQLVHTDLSFTECPGITNIFIEFLTLVMYVYSAVVMVSMVLLPTIIVPSGQSLKEFKEALQQRLELRQMANMDV